MTQEPILITGVGRRLGLHLARRFLSRGITVIGTYRADREGLAELRRGGG
ncbi:MAG: dihydromonapterin reductase/dihydrofolate reductase [Gammaproteobacteria bacterium]|jgi:dihydromonapterin reductase/dihydrofolate reductase